MRQRWSLGTSPPGFLFLCRAARQDDGKAECDAGPPHQQAFGTRGRQGKRRQEVDQSRPWGGGVVRVGGVIGDRRVAWYYMHIVELQRPNPCLVFLSHHGMRSGTKTACFGTGGPFQTLIRTFRQAYMAFVGHSLACPRRNLGSGSVDTKYRNSSKRSRQPASSSSSSTSPVREPICTDDGVAKLRSSSGFFPGLFRTEGSLHAFICLCLL